jgi:hypothetical protein
MTVAMTQAHLFEDTDAPWNAMMAAAILYALPPLAIFFRCAATSPRRDIGWRKGVGRGDGVPGSRHRSRYREFGAAASINI